VLSSMIADPTKPGSLAHLARVRRWAELLRCFPDLAEMRVLDLGGTARSWHAAPVRPTHVVTVNLDSASAQCPEPGVTSVLADACDPSLIRLLSAERFDLVYSNSLMEHVGGHFRRQQFAEAVQLFADRHWVQTPYRYFPVEPHWLFPGMQWLPFRARVAVSERWPHGHIRPGDRDRATMDVEEVELLSATEMRSYFPDSRIWFERFAGLPKSLVARV
jgi:hypothetical protein